MYRRTVHTLLGALAGYLVGAIVGMALFATVNGFRSVAIVEEPNRNRWAFVAAAGAAVVGGLIGWWRSYGSTDPAGPPVAAERDDDAPAAAATAPAGAPADAGAAPTDAATPAVRDGTGDEPAGRAVVADDTAEGDGPPS